MYTSRITKACRKPFGSRGFASEKELRNRLSTIKNISKVTKAMNMVAAAKLRKHQDALAIAKTFAAGLDGLFFEAETEKPTMVIPFSTDKGLCGGVNTAVNREAKTQMMQLENKGEEFMLFTYGGKSKGNLRRNFERKMVGGILDCGGGNPVTFAEASEVAEAIAAQDFGNANLIFNDFINLITYDTVTVTIPSSELFESQAEEKFMAYEEEGDEGGLFKNFYEFMLGVKLYYVINNAQTCEQSSRMTAMDNSSSNADEMYDKLLLQANRLRQAKITKELMEITSGAAAVQQ
uniref:ATP synthase subunit gamma n=1 Tax=Lotharella oceanica TaxID=641309 RepID=A0A7S2TXS1_9EUKA